MRNAYHAHGYHEHGGDTVLCEERPHALDCGAMSNREFMNCVWCKSVRKRSYWTTFNHGTHAYMLPGWMSQREDQEAQQVSQMMSGTGRVTAQPRGRAPVEK